MKALPKQLLLISLALIALLFTASFIIVVKKFRSEFTSQQLSNQQKLTRIVNQSLSLYFDKLKFATENAVLSPAFNPDKNRAEDDIRFKRFSAAKLQKVLRDESISKILVNPRKAAEPAFRSSNLLNWQVYKALPERDSGGNLIASKRRVLARNILKTFKDIHYVFEMNANGDLVFLEPFETQKNITSFNYEFRDYLHLANKYRSTVISEGYISHDQKKTQIITVATPIFDSMGRFVKVFAASVSAQTLHEKVFQSLKESMDLKDGTVFYLVDRHGHIVASSSGKNIYFPHEGSRDDELDQGNLRYTGFFNKIDWAADVLEKGNVWERNTKSWQFSSLEKDRFGEYQTPDGVSVFGSFYPTNIIGIGSLNWGILIETPITSLVTAERHLAYIFFIAGIVLVAILSTLSIIVLRSFNDLQNQIDIKQREIKNVSAQVAHDVRSPLAALEMILVDVSELPEEKRIIVRSAVSRIRDIANNLQEKKSGSPILPSLFLKTASTEPTLTQEPATEQLLSSLIDSLITEKRTQYRGKLRIHIDFPMNQACYGLFAKAQATELKRVLSNLINNSVEACGKVGKVQVGLTGTSHEILLSVTDNGPGIPPHVLPKLMRKGETYGKLGGSGLGLYHAQRTLKAIGGSLEITSEFGKGTTVNIRLPKVRAPEWFVPELRIPSNATIVALDDDSSIHHIWNKRAKEAPALIKLRLHHFTSGRELETWTKTHPQEAQEAIYLVDYELLGEKLNGLDIIERLNIAKKSILVTSRYEESTVRERCRKLGMRLIPKAMAGFVPLKFESPKKKFDAVLIDDDSLIHKVWRDSAIKERKVAKLFGHPDEFLSEHQSIHSDTPVYIDSSLENSLRGEEVAKEIYKLGFKVIYLATGYPANHFPFMPWIKGIVGKEPPWVGTSFP